MPLVDFYNKIVALQGFDLEREAMLIINENAAYLRTLLTNQLRQGKDGNDQAVTVFGRDFYSDATVFEKERHGVGFGKFTEWITNYMTGRFYSEIKVHTSGDEFVFTSDVEYFGDILRQSGDVIMELDAANLKAFSDNVLFPRLQEKFSFLWNGV